MCKQRALFLVVDPLPLITKDHDEFFTSGAPETRATLRNRKKKKKTPNLLPELVTRFRVRARTKKKKKNPENRQRFESDFFFLVLIRSGGSPNSSTGFRFKKKKSKKKNYEKS